MVVGRYAIILQPQQRTENPKMNRVVARTASANGRVFLTLRDELGPVFEDERIPLLYPGTGRPTESPARLALVTTVQFLANLTDQDAADVVRGRIDWKYGLGRELTDPDLHYSTLTELRQRLVAGSSGRMLLDAVLGQCEATGLICGTKKQRTDSTHILADVRSLT